MLTAAAKLKGVADPDLAAAFSVMLLCLGSEDANPSYLASAAAAVLMSQLLQVQDFICAGLQETWKNVSISVSRNRDGASPSSNRNSRKRMKVDCPPKWYKLPGFLTIYSHQKSVKNRQVANQIVY